MPIKYGKGTRKIAALKERAGEEASERCGEGTMKGKEEKQERRVKENKELPEETTSNAAERPRNTD